MHKRDSLISLVWISGHKTQKKKCCEYLVLFKQHANSVKIAKCRLIFSEITLHFTKPLHQRLQCVRDAAWWQQCFIQLGLPTVSSVVRVTYVCHMLRDYVIIYTMQPLLNFVTLTSSHQHLLGWHFLNLPTLKCPQVRLKIVEVRKSMQKRWWHGQILLCFYQKSFETVTRCVAACFGQI